MKILALDSSGLVASVAVMQDDTLQAEYTVNYKKTHSQTLLPMLDEVAKMTELDLNTIDAIAISGGPGSFTGLRIGSATAKGLGLALKKPLIHIPTVDALAFNLYGVEKLICPIMDARRNQVYTGLYRDGADTDGGGRAGKEAERAKRASHLSWGWRTGLSKSAGTASDGGTSVCTGSFKQTARGECGCSWNALCGRRKI